MYRTDRAPASSSSFTQQPRETGLGAPSHLRLAITRTGLSIELADEWVIDRDAGITLRSLNASLESAKFPVDVAAGWSRFRHFRSRLRSIEVAIDRHNLERSLARKWRDLVGSPPQVTLLSRSVAEQSATQTRPFLARPVTVGVAWANGAAAWDLFFCPSDEYSLAIVIRNARSTAAMPATQFAHLAMNEALYQVASFERGRYIFDRLPFLLCADAFLSAGARVPTGPLPHTSLTTSPDGWNLRLSQHDPDLHDSDVTQGDTYELQRLLGDSDQSLKTGDLDQARLALLQSLEKAPRNEEIIGRLAEIDSAHEHHEAALAGLEELPTAGSRGLLMAELLAKIGEKDSACMFAQQFAQQEHYKPLAGWALERASCFTSQIPARLALLEESLALAPSATATRWSLVRAYLDGGDVRRAVGQIDQLVSSALGPRDKHQALQQAGNLLLEHGHAVEALKTLERAVRFHPASIDGALNLAKAMLRAGAAQRAIALLGRVLDQVPSKTRQHDTTQTGESETVRYSALALLAQALGQTGNPSLGVARAREIPVAVAATARARSIEARLLHELGDRSSALVAYQRMREAIEQHASDFPAIEATQQLGEGADLAFEMGAFAVAKQLLGHALQLSPHDQKIASSFRQAAQALVVKRDPGSTKPRRS